MLIFLLLVAPFFILQGEDTNQTLRMPQQVTVGVSDQFLGQLSADEGTLYFVSNRNTTNEILAQRMSDGHVQLLFDDGADATWPRVSPDGKHLLYISFRDSAEGQLCVRDLPSGENRRCLKEPDGAVQAEWRGADDIVLVARGGIGEDLGVFSVRVGKDITSQLLFRKNLTGLAISPDGRWIVYVPTERYTDRIGPGFAAKAAARLEALRLDAHEKPVPFVLDLPGTSGQPAFSADGRFLYVAQFFSDSNHDGIVDATDHGVLFRVPFLSGADDAPQKAQAAMPEQLTESSWNCQYPAPAKKTLLASCTRITGGVDVYQLPLEGEVPPTLSAARLQEEIDLSTRRVEAMLLTRHLLAQQTEPTERRHTLMQLVQLHLEFDEFDAAQHYVEALKKTKDPATRGASQPLTVLIAHRRSVRERERGRMSQKFHSDARARMQQLSPRPTDSPSALALEHIVKSEIADTLGDKGEARTELEAADIAAVSVPSIIRAYYERADALYRELDDDAALITTCRALSANPNLAPKEQLVYARAAARAITRGKANIDFAAEKKDASPELAFALNLQELLAKVHSEKPAPEIRTALVALYKAQTRPDRRRAVMLDATQRANEFSAERLVEALVQLYLDSTEKGTQERVRSERLYRKVMLGRAYRHMGAGRFENAKKEFDNAVTQTASFEALVDALDLRLQLKEPPQQIAGDYKNLSPAMTHFVDGYLAAAELPKLQGKAHDDKVQSAIADLRASWPVLKQDRGAQALYGAIYHEKFLMHDDPSGKSDLDAAAKANAHYLSSLSLAGNNPRYRAMVLSELATLQTEVGNFHIALDYFAQRRKLPSNDHARTLSLLLSEARALLHAEREADAAKVGDEAVAMIDRAPPLAKFLPLALDRAALCNFAAGHFERALSLYDRLLPMLPATTRNAWVARLGHAAAALGAKKPEVTLTDLQIVDKGFSDPLLTATLRWPHTAPEDVVRHYRLIDQGLTANAEQKLGALSDVAEALAQRRELFAQQFQHSDRDDDLRALILVEARLADNARQRQAPNDAARWLDKAHAHAEALQVRTKTPVARESLDVLWLSAALRAFENAPLSFDVAHALQSEAGPLSGDRFWRSYQRWFEAYTTLLE